MNKKLWSGRFQQNTLPQVDEFNASIHFDYLFAEEDILGSLAHSEMLFQCNLITEREKLEIHHGLKNILNKIKDNQISFDIEDEDIHMNIERLLTNEIGKSAEKLHTARSRNDQVACDLHLYLRKEILAIMQAVHELQSTLINLAKSHQETLVPGYTHLQRAQPIYLAQYFLAYASMFQRDFTRLQEGWNRLNISPLGACALNGTTLPTKPTITAQLLGFDDTYLNPIDAVSDRDFMIEFLSDASILSMHLSRLSEELILWSTQEFNFISFDDNYSTGSSIMPQKKNPDIAELTRGKSGKVYGSLMALLSIMKGLPLSYNKDLQECTEPVLDVLLMMKQTLTINKGLLNSLKINTNQMHLATEQGFLNATALAEYLVQQNIPFREAHHIAGKMVAYCIEQRCQLESLSLTELQTFSSVIKEDIYAALDCQNAAKTCAGKMIVQQIDHYEQQFKQQISWIYAKNQILKDVYSNFDINQTSFNQLD